MEKDLDVRVRRAGAVPVVDLTGDIDSYTCSELRQVIIDLVEQGQSRIVVSMAGVNYIDSSGLGVLVGGLKRINEQDGSLKLSGASPQVKRILSITGLNRIFEVYDDEAEAVRRLGLFEAPRAVDSEC